MIHLHDITKVYPMGKRELTVLRGVSFSIEKGELVAIMGPSGSGKSTILNVLGCLDKPTSGKYVLDGNEVSRLSSNELAGLRADKIGFIFQSFNLLPRLSAAANVEMGLRYAGGVNHAMAIEALARVGLADRVNHKPSEMSGGEQQRVALARALAPQPRLLMLDEPLGALDRTLREQLSTELRRILRDTKVPAIYVTHDQEEAFAIADPVSYTHLTLPTKRIV